MFIGTDLDGNDDIVMSIYNIDQKQWLMKRTNQSMMIIYHSDHLYIDLKYRRSNRFSLFRGSLDTSKV